MKVVIDMNLTPAWVEFLAANGLEAQHWSAVGSPRASDDAVMSWARANGHVVLTHDLDFGALLALAGLIGPSVVLLRAQDVMPDAIGVRVLAVLRAHAKEIEQGALVVLDDTNARVRVLPVRSRA